MTRSAPRSARRMLAALLLMSFVLLVASPARAQEGERIRSYDVGMAIQSDGSLLVFERINYDFADQQRHGIFRDIRNRFTVSSRNDRVYPISDVDVVGSPGTPDGFETKQEGPFFRIKIGDADTTITGPHTYTISYRVEGALNGFPDHDELYWNAIGAEWAVPIDQASVRVTAPVDLLRVACFSGSYGSNLPCSEATFSGPTATFHQVKEEFLPWALGPFQGLTVVVGFPTGAVPPPKPILDERWAIQRAFSLTPVTVSAASVLLLLVVGGVLWLMWRNGRDRRAVGSAVDQAYATSKSGGQAVPLFEHSVMAVEYAPPEGIRPGQVGTLIDEVANPLDVTATVIDLAVRGYLRIEEIPKKWFLGKPDWRLVKLKAGADLLRYEQLLFDGLFTGADVLDQEEEDDDEVVADDPAEEEADDPMAPARPDMPPPPREKGMAEVPLSQLRTHFASRMARVQEALYVDANKRGWFAGRPDKVRSKWSRRGWLAFAVAVGVVVLVAAKTHLALIPVPLAIGGFLLIWGAHRMPRRTPKGTGMVRRVLGFRTYIDTAEVQEARFAERENLFSQYLPYAVVFGLTEKWAQAFSHLGDQPPDTSSWYVGTRAFTLASFTSSIDHFALSSAGTISSTPSGSGSSGFSSGGGFSGGGGGGGGGGSW